MAAVASCLALLSLENYNLETMLFPIYVVFISVFISVKADPLKVVNLKSGRNCTMQSSSQTG